MTARTALTMDMIIKAKRKLNEFVKPSYNKCWHGSTNGECSECIRWRPLLDRLNSMLQRGKL